nr:hypothetical protein CFP56_39033 [Quercus suber]
MFPNLIIFTESSSNVSLATIANISVSSQLPQDFLPESVILKHHRRPCLLRRPEPIVGSALKARFLLAACQTQTDDAYCMYGTYVQQRTCSAGAYAGSYATKPIGFYYSLTSLSRTALVPSAALSNTRILRRQRLQGCPCVGRSAPWDDWPCTGSDGREWAQTEFRGRPEELSW